MKFIMKPKPDLCTGCTYATIAEFNETTIKRCSSLEREITERVTKCSSYQHVSLRTLRYIEMEMPGAWRIMPVGEKIHIIPPHEIEKYEVVASEIDVLNRRK